MTDREAKDRLISLRTSYKIRIEEEDLEALDKSIESLENQKTGYWIKKNDICTSRVQLYQYECSSCREINTFDSNYCPHCGAKMGR